MQIIRKFSVAIVALSIISVATVNALADNTSSPISTSPGPDSTMTYQRIPVIPAGTTNAVATGTSNSLAAANAVLPVSDYDYVNVTVQYSPMSGSASGNSTIEVYSGPDASKIATAHDFLLTVPNNGANPVIWHTNLFVPAEGLLVFTNWNNPSGGVTLSNFQITASVKAKRVHNVK